MRLATLVLVLCWACNSDSKLQQGLHPPDVTNTTATTPGGGNPSESTTGEGSTPSGNTGDDDDNGTGTGGGGGDGGGGDGGGGDTASTATTSDTGLTDDEFCQKAATLSGFLDGFQTPDDGKVVFCHSGSGSHYSKNDTDISACLPHLNHTNDVFPTTGCDS